MASLVPSAAMVPLLSSQPSSHPRHLHRTFGSHSLTQKKDNGANLKSCMLPQNLEYVKVEDNRPLAHFPPDMWGDRFDSFTFDDQLRMEEYAKEIEPLKEEVRMMLLDNSSVLAKKMSLIDAVERLGFSYYYEYEINDLLTQLFKELSQNNFNMNHNLSDTAIEFRIFRQHGYNMPCDVFNKFLYGEGNFKEALKNDIRGMISLYEAAHLRIHGEDILEEAIVFTTDFLKSVASFSKQAYQALQQPLHRGIARVQIRHYISFYMKDKSQDEKLLRLAKMEYNRLQLLHCQELSQVQKWWKDFDFVRKFPYMRQRSVENHFSAVALCYQPQYYFVRLLLSRLLILITVLDDTCDAYATFEEIQQLTDAVERWDLHSSEQLPIDYLNNVYACVINIWDELANEMAKIGKPYAHHYLKEQLQKLVRNYLVEAKWVDAKYHPTFEEYIAVRRVTSIIRLVVSTTLLGMEEVKEERPLEQLLQADSKAQIAGEFIGGILDDIATGKAELARGARNVTSIECYMKDYSMGREEVLQVLKNLIEDAWKDMNYERLLINDSDLSSKHLFEEILAAVRAFAAFFKVADAFTFPNHGSIKDDIIAMYTKPFSV